jgi:hypothetical protein
MRFMVRLRFRNANAFLGLYLGRMRRGLTLLADVPDWTLPGDVVDVEVAVDGYEPLLLFAQVQRAWERKAELRFVAGRVTDGVVYPLLSQALDRRHANRLLAMLG